MTQIIFTGALGFLFLVGFSLSFVWLDERAKKRAKQKSNDRFHYFDKNYGDLERESQKRQKKMSEEIQDVFSV